MVEHSKANYTLILPKINYLCRPNYSKLTTVAKSVKSKVTGKITPLMQQYFQVKQKYPDAILLFRIGDFYETFGEDAVKTSQVLGIVLTARNNGGVDIELAGFPHHSVKLYLPKLVKAGYRVAICEQLEKPSKEKKIVKRGVTEVITPGIASDDQLLDHNKNNYFATLFYGKKRQAGVAFIDISTGEFLVTEGSEAYVHKILTSFRPAEVILPKGRKKEFEKNYSGEIFAFGLDEWVFTEDYTEEQLLRHFNTKNLKGFGIEELKLAKMAAGAALHYLSSTENTRIDHINRINRIMPDNYVWMDGFTIRSLELLHSPHPGGVSLIDIMDSTISPMGGRLMRKWVVLPAKNQAVVEKRHDIVSFLLDNPEVNTEVESLIKVIGDIERLISKVSLGKINPRELVRLQQALQNIGPMKEILTHTSSEQLKRLAERLDPCNSLKEKIAKTILPEPPINLNKGGVIADGADEELDDLRNIIRNSQSLLVEIQTTEAEKTGIEKLKIGFNNVFGYYLEVTNKYKGKGLIPDNWVRKQTLTNAERYITDELKVLEAKILGAEEKMLVIEERLYQELVAFAMDYVAAIQKNARAIAELDCLQSFARNAKKYNYCRPEMNDTYALDIISGRHPVIERTLPIGEAYIPNDLYLDNDVQQVMMITGPNMSGKSALLRQTALICIMAQAGSFVPAQQAKIGMIDKVFTRVGASDNISSGESTFMVEMTETAGIMNNISNRSLILLDEIGRGTSTYDGISIAWSLAEFLHDNPVAHPKTLFATHYHELNELAQKFPRIKNYTISIKEVGQKIVFLRKLIPGGSEHSFGIHVARMAGMPKEVVRRAEEILTQLETKSVESGATLSIESNKASLREMPDNSMQLSLFDMSDPKGQEIINELEELDLNTMTPLDCMMKLNELVKKIAR